MSPAQRTAARCGLSRELLTRHQMFAAVIIVRNEAAWRYTRAFGPLLGMLREAAA